MVVGRLLLRHAAACVVLLFTGVLGLSHVSAVSSNDSTHAPDVMYMEGESMSANLESNPGPLLVTATSSNPLPAFNSESSSHTPEPTLASYSVSTTSTSSTSSSSPSATEADAMNKPVEPLEVADLNKDPYRNATETETSGHDAGNEHVTHVIDDVTGDLDDDATTIIATTFAQEEDKPNIVGLPVTEDEDERPYQHQVINTVSQTDGLGVRPSQPALVFVVEHGDHGHLENGKTAPFSRPTEAAAIMAGVLISVAVMGYVGMLAWRKILEKRYGNREMLVNEDDGDLHHFEL